MWVDKILGNFFGKRVTRKDLNIIDNMKDIELADMSCILNTWKWPKELLDPEPEEYIPNGLRVQLMKEIERRVGEKLINRRENKDRMNDAEHEEYWKSDMRKILSISLLSKISTIRSYIIVRCMTVRFMIGVIMYEFGYLIISSEFDNPYTPIGITAMIWGWSIFNDYSESYSDERKL